MRSHFLHPKICVSSINIKAPQYNARYDKKMPSQQKYISQFFKSAVRGYMVAMPLLALVEVAHHQLSQQKGSNIKLRA